MKRVNLSRIKFASLAGLMAVAGCVRGNDPVTSGPVPARPAAPAPAKKAAPKVMPRSREQKAASPTPLATMTDHSHMETMAGHSHANMAAAAIPAKKRVAASTPSGVYRQIQEYERDKEYSNLFDSYSKKLQGNMDARMASAAARHLSNDKSEQKRYARMRGKELFIQIKQINPVPIRPYRIVSQKVTRNTAVLTVEEQGRKARKIVSMVKEKGIWKMDAEK